MSVRRAALACAAGAALAAGCGEGGDEVAPGVSRELARDRAGRISDLVYDVELSVPGSLDGPILGRVRVSFTLSEAGRPLALDFAGSREAVLALRTGPGPAELSDVDIRMAADHLLLPEEALREGPNLVEVEFRAGDGPLNRNPEFLYTLFVPDRAHRALPVFDQPDLKGRFRLTLEVPAGWEAVSNTPAVEEGPAVPEADGAAVEGTSGADGRRRVRFAETEPLPTYLFAFAAGRFRVEEAEREGRTMRMYHRETDSAKVARNREAVFDLHAAALEWLEGYTGIPYPFGKFDFVLVPSFQYGGMEHPGAILYRADGLLLDPSATKTDELGRASVIAHETAHMWFGDLVTMRWFDDVWMKEVFANFMAAKIVNPSFPEIDHELRFLLSHHPPAYAVDRTAGANPIRQELDNLREAGTLYGAIIYQKAPVVMRHLERLVGEETFRDGLREYLDVHRFGNASWPDLIEVLDDRAPEDLAGWSRVWVSEPGRPTVTLDVAEGVAEASGAEASGAEASAGGAAASGGGAAASTGEASASADGVRITVRQEDPRGRGLRWTQPLGVMVGSRSGEGRVLDLRLEGDSATATARLERGEGAFYLADGRGFGYGLFVPEPASREWLLRNLVRVRPPVARAAAWLGLWDGMLEGEVVPARLLGTALELLRPGREDAEELLVEQVLGDLRTLYWRFLPPDVQREARPRMEAVLWRGVNESGTPSLKGAYFRTLRSLATSPESIRRLVALWRGEMEIARLELSERDRTDLAQTLALRQAPGWSTILREQRAAIENPDRRDRFDFVRPALSPDPADRDTFFRSLAEPANRSHEPWVLEAVSFLHHPSRTEEAVRWIRPGLEMLEELQRTGDIFFPERWLDATLGGHRSPEAAGIVRDFLEDRPDLPRRLREKVLQSADLLFRAADRAATGTAAGDGGPAASADGERAATGDGERSRFGDGERSRFGDGA